MTANHEDKALARVDKNEPEMLMTDMMGSTVVVVEVGFGKKMYVVHKKLMMDASEELRDLFAANPDTSKAYSLVGVVPEIFDLFVEVIYSRRVPRVNPDSSIAAQATRVTILCRFYAFCNAFKLKPDIKEMVLGAIMDGFRVMDTLPEYPLILQVYKHTKPGDKLREFCAKSLLYTFVQGNDEAAQEFSLEDLLQSERAILHDFLEALRTGGNIRDPREDFVAKQQQTLEG